MANFYGYKTNLIISPQTTYGSRMIGWASAQAFNDTTIDMESAQQMVQRLIRSGTISETVCENIVGKVTATVTIGGVLTLEIMNKLFQGLTLDNTITNEFNSDDVNQTDDEYSFTIMRRYSDTLADIATGCTLSSLQISTDDNFVNFSATYDAKEIKRGETITGEIPEVVDCPSPIKLSSVSYDNTLNITPLSFSLTFNNEMDEDKINYGTSLTKKRCIVSKQTGTLTIDGIHNDNEALMPIGTQSIFAINLGGNNVVINLHTMIETLSIPDAQQGVYTKEYGLKIVKGEDDPMYDIQFN